MEATGHLFGLTDAQWQVIQRVLPLQRTGRPALDHRKILDGILWVLFTGAPWRALPAEYGTWTTVVRRFHRWQDAGIWGRIQQQLELEAIQAGHELWASRMRQLAQQRIHRHAACLELAK